MNNLENKLVKKVTKAINKIHDILLCILNLHNQFFFIFNFKIESLSRKLAVNSL
jgi:hypothetical protein